MRRRPPPLPDRLSRAAQVPLGLVVFRDAALWEDRVRNQSLESAVLSSVSSGFFLWEFAHSLWMMRYEPHMIQLVGHSVGSLVAFLYGVVSGQCHVYAGVFLGLWEPSTFFTCFRWFLVKTGWGKSKLYVANGVVGMGLFFALRVVGGLVVGYDFVKFSFGRGDDGEPRMPLSKNLPFLVAFVGMQGLNIYWFVRMSAVAYEHLTGKRKSKQA